MSRPLKMGGRKSPVESIEEALVAGGRRNRAVDPRTWALILNDEQTR